MTNLHNLSQGFVLEQLNIRGRLIRLDSVLSEIIGKHEYPEKVSHVLAQLIVAGAALKSLMKFDGIFTLQTRGSGPITLAVVDVTSDGNVRGYAQFDQDALSQVKSSEFGKLLGSGSLGFIVDTLKGKDQYQGMVELKDDELSASLEFYFDQSEQLESRVRIAVEHDGNNWRGSALILQKMPEKEDGHEDDAWDHVDALLRTLGRQEFLDFSLTPENLLFRLFHEVDLRIFPPIPFQAKCRCARERIQSFLSSLSPEEIEEFVINDRIDVTCEFCNHTYIFERKDVHTLH